MIVKEILGIEIFIGLIVIIVISIIVFYIQYYILKCAIRDGMKEAKKYDMVTETNFCRYKSMLTDALKVSLKSAASEIIQEMKDNEESKQNS